MATTRIWETATQVTSAGRAEHGVAGDRWAHLAGRHRLHHHQVLADRLLGLLVALDSPDQVGRLQAPQLADRLEDHLEPQPLVDRQVGRRAPLCRPAVAVGPVGRQED
jgi:hypothetical protein